MDKCCKVFCLISGSIASVFSIITSIIMLTGGQKVDLWIPLIVCFSVFVIACVMCVVIEITRKKEISTKLDTVDILRDAYERIFKTQ